MLEILSPGMQNAEKADAGSEVLRVGRDLEKRFCAGSEQQPVESLLVLQGQG
ncbi:MAG: hypothetical protein JWN34_1103 [Bryobacterales bacterium]|nr:hypothetical protein [Bryobacterales bacterium]